MEMAHASWNRLMMHAAFSLDHDGIAMAFPESDWTGYHCSNAFGYEKLYIAEYHSVILQT